MVTLRMRTGFSTNPSASARRLRDLLHHVHAFVDAPEGGELAVQRRLRRDADEELRAVAIRLAGNADRGDHAALVLEVAELAGELVEAAGAPEFARRFRIFQQRVAALNDAVRHHAMEGAAVVESLARERDEVLDVLGRFVGANSKRKVPRSVVTTASNVVRRLSQHGCHRRKQKRKKRGAHRLNHKMLHRSLPATAVLCYRQSRQDRAARAISALAWRMSRAHSSRARRHSRLTSRCAW